MVGIFQNDYDLCKPNKFLHRDGKTMKNLIWMYKISRKPNKYQLVFCAHFETRTRNSNILNTIYQLKSTLNNHYFTYKLHIGNNIHWQLLTVVKYQNWTDHNSQSESAEYSEADSHIHISDLNSILQYEDIGCTARTYFIIISIVGKLLSTYHIHLNIKIVW